MQPQIIFQNPASDVQLPYLQLHDGTEFIGGIDKNGVGYGTLLASAGGAASTADYVISKSGANYIATSSTGFAAVAANADAAAVLTSCIANLGGFGTIEFMPGDYTWSSVPAIPRNYANGGTMNPRWLRIIGNGARIILSSSGPRFLDYGRQADYDTFANFELGGFVVDAAGMPVTTGPSMHVVIGTTVLGGQRLNFYHQWIHDIKAINIPTGGNSANPQRYGIWTEVNQLAVAETTNNYMIGFRIERCRFEGGDTGILVAANGVSSAGLRVYGGDWYIADCWHDTGITPTGTFSGSNFQLGGLIASYASVASGLNEPSGPDLVIERCFGRLSGDDGIETNGFMTINVIDCVMEDCWNEGYTAVNYNYLNGVDATSNPRQQVNYIRCIYRATTHGLNPGAGNYGWEFTAVGYSDTGGINIVDCAYQCATLDVGAAEEHLAIFVGPTGTQKITRIRIENFTSAYDSVVNATANSGNVYTMIFNGPGPCDLILRDLNFHYAGSESSTGIIFLNPLEIYGQDYRIDIDGVTIYEAITGRVSDTTRCIEIGQGGFGGGNSKTRGSIRGLRWANASSGDQSPRGVWIYGTGTSTISDMLFIDNVDFTVLSGDPHEIYLDATQANYVVHTNPSFQPSYYIYKRGASFAARGGKGLPDIAPNADAASVLQSCMDTMNGTTTPRGTIVFAPNTDYTWSSIPLIRRTYASAGADDNGWLRILGSGGSRIQLSSTGHSFLSCNWTANGDGFCGIELGHLEINSNSITGNHHIIVGNINTGVVGFGGGDLKRWWLHDIFSYGAISADGAGSPNTQQHVCFYTQDTSNIIDFKCQRIKMLGGNFGLTLQGGAVGGTQWIDDVLWEDCYHDRSVGGAIGNTDCCNFQIGSKAQVGSFRMINCYGKGSGDGGLEIDNAQFAVVENCEFENCYNGGFFLTNFVAPLDYTSQQVIYKNCRYQRTGTYVGNHYAGFSCQPLGGLDVGSVTYKDCAVYVNTSGGMAAGEVEGLMINDDALTGVIRRVLVDGFTVVVENMLYNSAANAGMEGIRIQLKNGTPIVTLRDLYVYMGGNQQSTGILETTGVRLNFANAHLDIDGYTWSNNVTNQTSGSEIAIGLMLADNNSSIATQVIRADIRRLNVDVIAGGELNPEFAQVNRFNTAGHVDTAASMIRFTDCDFSKLIGTYGEIAVGSNSQPFVQYHQIRWRDNNGVKTGGTITVPATGTSWQNTMGFPVMVYSSGGTVTALAVAPDNSTFTTTGLTSGGIRVDPGGGLKPTYTAVPTWVYVPVK